MRIPSRLSLHQKFLAAILIVIVATFASLAVNSWNRIIQVQEAIPLRKNIEGGSDCQRPCWQAIQPGISDSDVVNDLLQNTDVNLNIIPRLEGGLLSYEWQQNDQRLVGFSPEKTRSVILVFSEENVVLRVIAWVDICVSRIVSEYGAPTRVEPDKDFGTSYQLLYPDEGLIFVVDGVRAILLIRTTSEEFPNTSEGRNWDDVDDMLTGTCVDGFSN